MKNNPPIDIQVIKITPNGDGSQTVSIAYRDNPDTHHNSACCHHSPKPTRAERQIAREKQTITRAESRIAAIQQGSTHQGATGNDNPFEKLLPRKWRQQYQTPRQKAPMSPRQLKFRNILLGFAIGTTVAALYILLRIA